MTEHPPSWLDTAADHDTAPAKMQPELQRGRNKWAKHAWRWECNIHGPPGTPYAGSSYRVLVRVPVGYPQLPPRLLVLSIFSHLEVETRDPYEGQLDDSFYECLEEVRARASHVATLASGAGRHSSVIAGSSASTSDGGGKRPLNGYDGVTRQAKRPPAETTATGASSGDAVAVADAASDAHLHGEDPNDAAERPYTIAMALALLVRALKGPLPQPERPRPAAPHPDANASAAADDDAAGASDDAAGGDVDAAGTAVSASDAKYAVAWGSVAASHEEDAQTCAAYRRQCLHAELFDAQPQASWFAPSFAAAFADGPPSAAAVRALVDEVSPGVFAFDFLSPAFCEQLLCELEHYEASGLPVVRPNSMNNYGVVLNSIGMEKTIDALQRRYVRVLAAALFPIEGEHVDHHHAFMVQYRQGEDLGLDMHTDACDVTLNVCLGKEFTGAGLTFCGLRGGGHERTFAFRHQHVKGRAIMHVGHHRHGADDIVTGERYNLILWNKSSTFRASKEYMSKMARPPSDEADQPDLVCLSYTHDDDFEQYKPLPPGVVPKRERSGG